MTLREYLDKYGITVTGFARRCGITKSYLSLIINGHKQPSKTVATCISLLSNGEVNIESLIKSEKKTVKKEKKKS